MKPAAVIPENRMPVNHAQLFNLSKKLIPTSISYLQRQLSELLLQDRLLLLVLGSFLSILLELFEFEPDTFTTRLGTFFD